MTLLGTTSERYPSRVQSRVDTLVATSLAEGTTSTPVCKPSLPNKPPTYLEVSKEP